MPQESELLSPSAGDQDMETRASDAQQLESETGSSAAQNSLPTPGLSFANSASTIPDSDLFASFTDRNLDWNLDWLFSSNLDEGLPSIQSILGGNGSSFNVPPEGFQEPVGTLAGFLARDSDGNSPIEENLIRFPGLQMPNTQDRCGPDDPWPMEWHAAPLQLFVLPPLGSPDQEYLRGARHFPTIAVSSSTIKNLQSSLLLPLERSPWQAVSLAAFPSGEKLDHCIDMYFKHFDWILPVIHRPTFDPSGDLRVTLGIACIGACYSGFEGARAFSNALSELLRRLLMFMAEHDPRFVRTESYVTAQLLQGAHGYGSGSRRLFDLSETCRSSLVHHARGMRLFRHRRSSVPTDAGLEERWRAWIADEKLRRLGWAIYGHDSSASYLFNTRPYINVVEIDMDLPSSTEHWEADSAQAWVALHPWTESGPQNLRFKPVIRGLFDGTEKPFAKITDDHHRLPIILTLLRTLWGVREFEANPLSDFINDRSATPRNRKILLDVLDRFIDSPTDPSALYTRKARVGVVHTVQTVHMSYLVGAGDMMDWLSSLVRAGPEVDDARARMRRWAAQDAARVREVAYRSAQILSIIRQYPYNLPMESFDVFYAGAALWCVADLLPQEDYVRQTVGPERQLPVCRLDYLGAFHDPETVAIRAWVKDGRPQIVSIYGVPNLSSGKGRQQILEQTAEILRRMHVWGIARNFLNVVLGLMQEDS